MGHSHLLKTVCLKITRDVKNHFLWALLVYFLKHCYFFCNNAPISSYIYYGVLVTFSFRIY